LVLDQMKLAVAILSATLSWASAVRAAEQDATNSAVSLMHGADWQSIRAAQSRKPLSEMSITNRVSQDEILSLCDPVCVHHGLTNYLDAKCSWGARLARYYVGSGSVCRISFLWDGSPKITRFSIYGTNSAAAALWHAEMLTALRSKLGPESVKVEVQPAHAANPR